MPLKRTETCLELKIIENESIPKGSHLKDAIDDFKRVLEGCEVLHEIHMPFPPTVNNYYSVVNGRKILSRRGREYHRICGYWTELPKMIKSDVSVEFDILMPDRRKRDIDNLLKPMLDALVRNFYIEDDCLVKRLTITNCGIKKGGKVICRIIDF